MGKKKSSEIRAPFWMQTLGDAMALMLTFFVLLFTFSSEKEQMLQEAMAKMKMMGGASVAEDHSVQPPDAEAAKEKQEDKSEEETKAEQGKNTSDEYIKPQDKAPEVLHKPDFLKKVKKTDENMNLMGFEHNVRAEVLDEGIRWRIKLKSFFKKGSTEVKAEASKIVDQFIDLIAQTGNEIRITTQFNPEETSGQSPEGSAWGIALRRARKAGEFLNEKYGISEKRFGYGACVRPRSQPEVLDVLLVERIGTRRVQFEELLAAGEE